MDWENDAKCHHIVGPCPPPPFTKGGVGPSKNGVTWEGTTNFARKGV